MREQPVCKPGLHKSKEEMHCFVSAEGQKQIVLEFLKCHG